MIAVPRLQRAEGNGRVSVTRRDGAASLRTLHQDGAAKIRLPRVHDGRHAEAVLINVCGGMTGGDRFNWTAQADDGAALMVTTQACEKIYRAGTGEAQSTARLHAGAGASLSWLPQEAILFDGAALTRRIEADVAADGRLLLLESAVIGRAAMGEVVTRMQLADRWRIRCGGVLVHAEEMRLSGDPAGAMAGPALLGDVRAFGGMVLIAPDAARFLDALRALPPVDGAMLAASAPRASQSGKLVARFAARDGFALRSVIIPAVELLNKQALGLPGLPKVWRL